jgi:signal transduction histidine kinase/ActR/RegA family two-component response regulator
VTERWLANRRILSQVEHLTMLDQITRAIAERHDLRSIYQVVAGRIESDLPADLCCVCRYVAETHTLTVECVGPAAQAAGEVLPLAEHDVIEVMDNGLARVAAGHLVHERHLDRIPLAFTQRLAGGGLMSLVMAPLRSESRVFGAIVVARRTAEGFTSGECEFLRQTAEHVALGANQAQLHSSLQEAYDDLRQSQQAVTQLERLRAMSEMASGVAHDINNALSPVLLYAEVLLAQEQNLSDRAREYLGMMQYSIRSVSETVSRIREFSRPQERGRTPVSVELNGLVEQAVAFTHARWGDIAMRHGSTIDAVVELASDLPTVLGVDNEIRDALTNLILNAADALPTGGTITLRTWTAASDTGYPMAVIEVRDNGVGMDAETVRRCLEPFYTTKGDRGTGLGLAMVFGTMQRHGGRIEIDSAPGQGTAVLLHFPAEVVIPDVPHERPSTAAPARSLRVLVVDDDPSLLRSLETVLKVDGHEPVVAVGGEQGLAAFRRSRDEGPRIDAVITDLGMPKVDGRQVAAGVKALSPETPVILLTGWGRRLLAENDIPPHVDRVLSKPPTLDDLRAALTQVTAAGRPEPGP